MASAVSRCFPVRLPSRTGHVLPAPKRCLAFTCRIPEDFISCYRWPLRTPLGLVEAHVEPASVMGSRIGSARWPVQCAWELGGVRLVHLRGGAESCLLRPAHPSPAQRCPRRQRERVEEGP